MLAACSSCARKPAASCIASSGISQHRALYFWRAVGFGAEGSAYSALRRGMLTEQLAGRGDLLKLDGAVDLPRRQRRIHNRVHESADRGHSAQNFRVAHKSKTAKWK